MSSYTYNPFTYRTPPELSDGTRFEAEILIVGAGPVGLAAAIDLALHGIKSIVIDGKDMVSLGSRALCWSKRTLEIFNRLGVGRRMVEKGVTWQVGRVFRGEEELYSFNLLPEHGHEMPAFVNLQQYYVEEYLIARAQEFPELIDLRWKNQAVALDQRGDQVEIAVETPDGMYRLSAPYVLACDGARSSLRKMMGLELEGHRFAERFLIADVEMKADFPPERHFWFDPGFHKGESALIHKQPDDIYRIDFQLSPDVDPQEEIRAEHVKPRIKAAVGDRPFTVDWVSIYTFQCSRLPRFVHGRVIFAGDSAHVVSPFGARGGNGGIQDIDNLVWKLALVLKGAAPETLLQTYDEERGRGADENLLNSARSTTFMTPKTDAERQFRQAVLDLSRRHDFARKLLNSGRLSVPCSLEGLSLQTPAKSDEPGLKPGAPCLDAELVTVDGKTDFLLRHLGGAFKLLVIGSAALSAPRGVDMVAIGPEEALRDSQGFAAARYGQDMVYLIRPDQHVAARFKKPRDGDIEQALGRAQGELCDGN